ncbi:MAG: GNAT family N-acetyltransferase [Rhodocyclaceae bacterium]|nr:GNAT family N-acetyltransferase [Rhodocyclaceae bacterium]
MRYARENLADIQAEIEPLLARHYAELGQQDMALDPDWPRLIALDAARVLVTYTARDDKRRLVGYAGFFVQPHLHYRHSVTAVNDVIWMAPECRGGVGVRLLRFAEIGLSALGAEKVYYHVKVDHPALGKILSRMGYTQAEAMFSRRIG